ncbi:hypothetical protein LENED_003465 [Lentinula edodes]|uniref:Uncharacterized protein n=1 Tax=Lentinula edodes TaxID=5353 RepID=A0A1Q3E422_LENED|nr:hypothetical protein LENED_003465 [Lentinula edodes]
MDSSSRDLKWKALREAYSLAQTGHTSIILEACRVLESLPIPVTWNIPEFEDITAAYLNGLIVCIQESMDLERTLKYQPRPSCIILVQQGDALWFGDSRHI